MSNGKGRLSYFSPSTQQWYDLDYDTMYSGTAPNIRGNIWSYNVAAHNITGVTRTAREETFVITTTDFVQITVLMQAYDNDVEVATPGIIRVDDWQQNAYIVKTEAETISPRLLQVTVTVILLDGVWHCDTEYSFQSTQNESDTNSHGLNYAHNYLHNYTSMGGTARTLTVNTLKPAPVTITIWGKVQNPSIRIGSNIYAVNTTIPQGAILTIDGMARTVIMTNPAGNKTNLFSKAKRESGAYIFEQLHAGANQITWNNQFDLQVTVHELSGYPEWKK